MVSYRAYYSVKLSSSYDRGTEELKSPVKDVDELWDRGWEGGEARNNVIAYTPSTLNNHWCV